MGALLHWHLTEAQYEALTVYELEEARSVMDELTRKR